MGVDIYMSWDDFGEEKEGNPNYDNQITGYIQAGKYGYLRVAYSNNYYDFLTDCFDWSWDDKVELTKELIIKFEIKVDKFPMMLKEEKKEWLAFAQLAKDKIKEDKHPKVYISY